MLVDENNDEFLVNSFFNDDKVDIIANNFVGKKLSKKSLIRQNIQVRSIGPYGVLKEQPIPQYNRYNGMDYIMSQQPQKLSRVEKIKLINNGYIDVLKEILLYQTNEPMLRLKNYESILKEVGEHFYYAPNSFINKFCKLLYALSLNPFFINKEGRRIECDFTSENKEFNNAFKDKGVRFTIKKLTEADTKGISHGEVTSSETFNYRIYKSIDNGLFCEKIFGPINDLKCKCGKLNGVKHKNKICTKCGVEVTDSAVRKERMGHIKLAIPISHPILEDTQITMIPILPSDLRRYLRDGNEYLNTSCLNNLYIDVINVNNRLKKLISLNCDKIDY